MIKIIIIKNKNTRRNALRVFLFCIFAVNLITIVMITLVASLDLGSGIGKDNELLYKSKADMKRFVSLTKG
jgi:hypothetical protein